MKNLSDFRPKGILLDVDGTLVNSKKTVSVNTINAIKKIIDKGIKVGVSTGRSYPSLANYILPMFPPESLHIIAGGGQIVKGSGEIVWEKNLASAAVKLICQTAERLGGKFAFGQGKILYCSGGLLQKYAGHPWKIEVRPIFGIGNWTTPLISLQNINQEIFTFLKEPDINIFFTETSFEKALDVTAAGVNKLSAAKIWSEMLGLTLKDIMSIGDSVNDLELIRGSGFSVAMGQSPEILKSHADTVIGNVDEDGLAAFLEKFTS